MKDNLAFAVVAFTSLLVVYNPLSAMPVFVSLTRDDTERGRRTTALIGVIASVVVMVAFGAAGPAILTFFGITTEAFQIAAGILFFGVGSDMLQAQRSRLITTRQEQDEASHRNTTAIVPLGLPTLSGPGTIVTMIALNAEATNPVQVFSVYVAAVLVGVVTLPLLLLAPAVLGALGRTTLNVAIRIMGLLVMVVGVQFIINGATGVIATWGD